MPNFTKLVENKLTEIKPLILKDARYVDNCEFAVKVFACYEEKVTTFDIEVQILENGKYLSCYVSDTFYSETDEESAKKEAIKRAKVVLRSVKKWVEYTNIEVVEEVEFYHS